jgi:hypothetical protein
MDRNFVNSENYIDIFKIMKTRSSNYKFLFILVLFVEAKMLHNSITKILFHFFYNYSRCLFIKRILLLLHSPRDIHTVFKQTNNKKYTNAKWPLLD